MASQLPDPRTFESWEDAFQYPIPAVSGMERKLRTSIAENHEKLRTLVGSSYRDLLGTARTIVNADKQMHQTEDLLVELGRRSDSRILEKIARNQDRISRIRMKEQAARYTYGSQLSLLQKCVHVVHRLLKNRSSYLLAARIILVSRSLHRTLSKDTDSELLEKLGNRLATLRQRLLRLLDSRFEAIGSTPSELVADMTAFSLVTSSSASDVTRHFQHLRLQAIKKRDGTTNIKTRLAAYLDTQQEIRAVFPDLLHGSLKNVAARPLLDDPALAELTELNLDIYIRWLPGEVRNFTPYARFGDAKDPTSSSMLDTWTEDALKSLLMSVEADVQEVVNVEEVVSVRKEVVQTWLSSKRYRSTLSRREVLDELRSIFIKSFSMMCESAFKQTLENTTTALHATLQHSIVGLTGSLWELATPDMDFSNAALSLRKAVVDRRLGRTAGGGDTSRILNSGWEEVLALQSACQRMKETRWDDDDLDEDEDDDDENDATTTTLLSKDDPATLQKALRTSAAHFVDSLEQRLEAYAADRELGCGDPKDAGLQMLRLIRDIRRQLPKALHGIDPDLSRRVICSGLVADLHHYLTDGIKDMTGRDLCRRYLDSVANSHRLRILWDGNPPLPVQLSPTAFKLLRAVVTRMELFGSDVWCPSAVRQLCDKLNRALATSVRSGLDGPQDADVATEEAPQTNGTSLGRPTSSEMAASELDGTQDGAAETNGDTTTKGEEDSQSNGADPKPSETENETATEEPPQSTAANGDSDVHEQTEPSSAESIPAMEERRKSIAATNGDAAAHVRPGIPPAKVRSWTAEDHTQLLFDVLYLSNALRVVRDASDDDDETRMFLQTLVPSLQQRADLPEASLLKLRKSAADYWRRTYLLFGLLCTWDKDSSGP